VEVIGRVGVVIPAGSSDPAGDARRLESLGFGHALLSHGSVPVLLALGATRRLRLLTSTAVLGNLRSLVGLPQESLGRLGAQAADDRPLPVDPADVASSRAAIADGLSARPYLTVDVAGPHRPAVNKLALDVLTWGLPGRPPAVLCAEDLVVGQTFDLGEHQVTEDDIVSFAERFDPLDFHLDPHLASASPIGVLCASGVHTQAVMQRLSARGFHRSVAVIAGRGMLGLRLPKPVTPGIVLRGATEIIGVRLRVSGRAIVTVRSTLRAADELMLEQTGELVVRQRHAAS